MQKTYDFLRFLSERLSPPNGKHHSITLSDVDDLYLLVWYGECPMGFYLVKDDFEKDPSVLVGEIMLFFK